MSDINRKRYTLIIIKDQEKLLLGHKKRGFGLNKICGFGGKVEGNESIRDGAIREVKEECGVDVTATIRQAGKLEHTFEGENLLMEFHVFEADGFSGTPIESDEMRPEWFPMSNIPYERMFPDDIFWCPLMLRGGCFKGAFHYKGENTILNFSLEEISQNDIDSLVEGTKGK